MWKLNNVRENGFGRPLVHLKVILISSPSLDLPFSTYESQPQEDYCEH
jgi:hypothetical protein